MFGKITLPCVFVCLLTQLCAQMPNDGLFMNKGQLCTMIQYNHNSWTEYWEGENKRSNSNLGAFTNQNVMWMSAWGIQDNLNLMAALPYIWTSARDTYLDGQRGFQDLSVWLKWQPYQLESGAGKLKLQLTGGLSTPVSNYPSDYLPFSIGLHSRSASLRGIVHFETKWGMYATAQAGHTWRGSTTIDRDSYLYNYQLYHSDKVPVPNFYDATARLGFLNKFLQAEVSYDRFACLDGDNIRYNDMPFPANKMEASSIGGFVKYWFTSRLAVSAGANTVLNGKNVGQSTGFNGAFFFLINTSKKSDK